MYPLFPSNSMAQATFVSFRWPILGSILGTGIGNKEEMFAFCSIFPPLSAWKQMNKQQGNWEDLHFHLSSM